MAICFVTCRAPSSETLRQLNSHILRMETAQNTQDIKTAGYFSFFYDGATRNGELIAGVVRIIDNNLNPVQRLSLLQTLEHSVDSDTLCAVIAGHLTSTFDVGILNPESIKLVACFTHDSAAVNPAAILKLVCEKGLWQV